MVKAFVKMNKTIIMISICILGYSAILKANDPGSGAIENKEGNNRAIELLLFPINLAPDIVANTVLYLFNPVCSMTKGEGVSNLWLPISVLSPVMGPVTGTFDAWYGYPFWDPVALDEDRKY